MEKYTLNIGGIEAEFDTKAEYDRYKYLLDLFEPALSNGEVSHTNMEPSVLLSEDNPFTNGNVELSPSGTKLILEKISDKDWEEKYESISPAYMKRVDAVDPHGPEIKVRPKKKEKKSEPFVKTWVGAPYTEEEMALQNQRYTFAQDSNSSMSVPCTSCIPGIQPKGVWVDDCDGNGPFHFPCAFFEGATPTNAMLGLPVSCAQPGNPYYLPCGGPCWGSQWVPTSIVSCSPGFTACALLKQDPICVPTPTPCATPHQLSYQNNANYDEWPGPGASPAPPEHMQSQNAIDEQKEIQASMIQTGTNIPCIDCHGTSPQWGAKLYKCYDGSGPYYYSNFTINGGQQPDQSVVGRAWQCNPNFGTQPGGDCHLTTCWGTDWLITELIPTGQLNTTLQAHMCVDIVEVCVCPHFNISACPPPCAVPHQPNMAPVHVWSKHNCGTNCPAVDQTSAFGCGAWIGSYDPAMTSMQHIHTAQYVQQNHDLWVAMGSPSVGQFNKLDLRCMEYVGMHVPIEALDSNGLTIWHVGPYIAPAYSTHWDLTQIGLPGQVFSGCVTWENCQS